MYQRNKGFIIFLAVLVLFTAVIAGCGPKSPVYYQTLQIQDTEDAAKYDIYMYIAVDKGLTASQVTELLEWFRDVKFADQNRIKIFVWDNPQSALISAMGDMVATLYVDREQEIDEIRIS